MPPEPNAEPGAGLRAELRVDAAVWTGITDYLHAVTEERMAYLLAHAGRWRDPSGTEVLDLLVELAIPVPDAALLTQSAVRVEVDPAFTREILIGCYEGGLSLIDVHTHPFSDTRVAFSGHDVRNMGTTHADFLARMPAEPPVAVASLVLGRSSVAGVVTDPRSGLLRPLTRCTVLGAARTEVALCH